MHSSYGLLLAAVLAPAALAAPAPVPQDMVIVTITEAPVIVTVTDGGSAPTAAPPSPVAPVVAPAAVSSSAPAPPKQSSSSSSSSSTTFDVAASTYTNDDIFKQNMVDGHNFYRSEHGSPPLVWNDTSAAYAQNWANPCVFKHSGGPTGENLAAGGANPLVSVDMWGTERETYNWDAPTYNHFTAMVWKDTTTVGCARKQCNEENGTPGWYVVCEYYPEGNIVGNNWQYFDENVGKLVSGKITDTIVSH
ncbi:hypothetical protein G7Y89_g12393 [Cudoniella acicularis]|uniref:SCP domain-containing protein n=1 Tax=Cudoniella acicularis TaxID=354080 RepID=A0A8H4R8X7_9HELO|nr:hypothetical protein G7Y89_g12393 [Cudoniella acicularis]